MFYCKLAYRNVETRSLSNQHPWVLQEFGSHAVHRPDRFFFFFKYDARNYPTYPRGARGRNLRANRVKRWEVHHTEENQ